MYNLPMLTLFNTLTKKKEEFIPLKTGTVTMYNCGPTVYNYAHIGNLRAYVFADILRRTLEYSGLAVTQVVNITDIGHLASDGDEGEDKMTKGLKREGKPLTLEAMKELADFYTNRFTENLKALNIELPAELPKASEHITEDIELVKKLEEKRFAYATSDGIYFDTSKDPEYGKLGGINKDDSPDHARIHTNTEKRNSKDFALWKFNSALGFESPWGKGFPGWHIECSAMSMKYLGETLDIHTGGIDHIPVHHNNEIAQSECATGKPFARFWLHSAFVTIAGEKMAKSDGNFLRLQTLIDRGIHPLAYRYWLLTAHYRSPITFAWEAVEGAHVALEKIVYELVRLSKATTETKNVDEEYKNKFEALMENDLGTPETIALFHELLADVSIDLADKLTTIFEFDKILGLDLKGLVEKMSAPLPESIETLRQQIETHRKNKDWQKSDEVRKEIEQQGYKVQDLKDQTLVERMLRLLI